MTQYKKGMNTYNPFSKRFIKTHRKFGNKYFKLRHIYGNKKEAKLQVAWLKRRGFQTRLLPSTNSWLLYWRG